MTVRILLNQYDITGGRQNFAPPMEVPESEKGRIESSNVLDLDAYRDLRNKHFESMFWGEWNSTISRPNYMDLIQGIKHGLYSIVKDDFVRYGITDGVRYEEFPPSNGVIHYAVKTESMNRHFCGGMVVYDGWVASDAEVVTVPFQNRNDKAVTIGIHVLDCHKCTGGLEVMLYRGDSEQIEDNRSLPVTIIRRHGGYLFDTSDPKRDLSAIRFRAAGGSKYRILAFLGVYS